MLGVLPEGLSRELGFAVVLLSFPLPAVLSFTLSFVGAFAFALLLLVAASLSVVADWVEGLSAFFAAPTAGKGSAQADTSPANPASTSAHEFGVEDLCFTLVPGSGLAGAELLFG
ncbi:MAG: hypothetical protein ACJ8F3_16565 [Xanthobacteraceae bacterium]